MSRRGEMGQQQYLGGQTGRREKDTGRLNPNDGGYSSAWKRLCLSSRWTIVYRVLGSGCWEFSLYPGWPILYLTLHLTVSHHPWLLLCPILFGVVLCLTMYPHKKKSFWRDKSVFFFLFLSTFLWQGKNAESSCPNLSHGTKCKDHCINHQTCKNRQRQKQPSDNEADYSRNLHPYTPRPLHIWPSRRKQSAHRGMTVEQLHKIFLFNVNLKAVSVITMSYIFLRALNRNLSLLQPYGNIFLAFCGFLFGSVRVINYVTILNKYIRIIHRNPLPHLLFSSRNTKDTESMSFIRQPPPLPPLCQTSQNWQVLRCSNIMLLGNPQKPHISVRKKWDVMGSNEMDGMRSFHVTSKQTESKWGKSRAEKLAI